ncbi:TIGR01244 family sulfur transferase [Herbaspirillum sp. RTI4]|uniref:TIGR01244 family sulfur transferase n=1 Tax=Herbaspirillum sp. RTI4 TaxID=3048640 RepID=UPI002AB340B6|nr:TIGR01244 family sulfur transferase [Herbaspirillum sp. RTI4]MDY7578905.1 TIGR01244 family sulfur transferase [Herbaspirillum sp. RTI4]MEA9981994.1 TIGR01244 family sulfur transferase [Herbaspirillum sp. RTI4]
MLIRPLTNTYSVSAQLFPSDIASIHAAGYRSLVCCRPDGETAEQPLFSTLEQEARALGMEALYFPVTADQITDMLLMQFDDLVGKLPKPVLAFCRTGARANILWDLVKALKKTAADSPLPASGSTPDAPSVSHGIVPTEAAPSAVKETLHDVVIVGAGTAGIMTAIGLLKRKQGLSIVLIEPSEGRCQPGWTLVGNGEFLSESTTHTTANKIPTGVRWIEKCIIAFEPERNAVILEDGDALHYRQLVICPRLKPDWDAIEGLSDTLGRNGVTSSYTFELAPQTWELVQKMRGGHALFTQPPLPVRTAGAAQKEMYLSADYWQKTGDLSKTDIDFCNAGAVFFGGAAYVPALMEYVEADGIRLQFNHQLIAVDGGSKVATFSRKNEEQSKEIIQKKFDMLHVVPPQAPPDFIHASPLSDASGWVSVDPTSLRHSRFSNIYALGDVIHAPHAKTAAAARLQAPVVVHNVLAGLGMAEGESHYSGDGASPLTVESGKMALAEFLYGGKVMPNFPDWLINGPHPARLAWLLKERILPALYWQGMLRGRELRFQSDSANEKSNNFRQTKPHRPG